MWFPFLLVTIPTINILKPDEVVLEYKKNHLVYNMSQSGQYMLEAPKFGQKNDCSPSLL